MPSIEIGTPRSTTARILARLAGQVNLLHRIRDPRFVNRVYRSRAGLWAMELLLPRYHNVLAVLDGPEGRFLIPAHNIVGDAGDIWYAQKGASATPTNVFGIGELASAGTPGKAAIRSGFTVIGSTQKAHTATYPKVNDGDTDNTGAGVDIVTFLQSYTKADFTAASITHGIITNTAPAAGEPILTGYAFGAAFGKTASDTLKVFQNHTMNGV